VLRDLATDPADQVGLPAPVIAALPAVTAVAPAWQATWLVRRVGLGVARGSQSGQDPYCNAHAEASQSLSPGDRLGHAFGHFIELVVHNFQFSGFWSVWISALNPSSVDRTVQ